MAKVDALAKMIAGYGRFRAEVFPEYKDHFRLLAEMQKPDVLFITCADSRVVPQLIFQTEPGDLFICRNVGNVVPPQGEMYGGTSSTVEYAIEVLHVRHIVICGHSDCGAARAVWENRDLAGLPVNDRWLRYVDAARPLVRPSPPATSELERLKEFICANVRRQVENLLTHTPVRNAMDARRLQVHGWFYDIQSGCIEAIDLATGEHTPIRAPETVSDRG
jgi:carbonic anhydrase